LHHIACGFGRRADADDIIQILYTRWWQRLARDPSWLPPEQGAGLFVCVKRVVIDEVAKDKRLRARNQRAAEQPTSPPQSPEDSLQAFQRLRWIVAHLPAQLAEVLMASLSAGTRRDPEVASELGLTPSAYTSRLFRARRAAEVLATYYDVLTPEQAHLMAQLRYSGKSRSQVAHELCLLRDELTKRWQQALEALEQHAMVAAL